MTRKRGRFSTFIIGSTLGAVAGMLFAPKKGEELREDIRKRTEELTQQGREAYDAQRTKITTAIETGKEGANKRMDDIRERVEDTRKRLQEQVDEAKKKVKAVDVKEEPPTKRKTATKKK